MGLQNRNAEFALTILDSSLDGVLAHTIDGQLVYFNETASAQLGYTRDEFGRLGPYGWVDDENIALVPSRLRLIAERGSLLFNSRGARRDGSVIHTEVHARTVRSGDEDLVVSVVRDVTERVDFGVAQGVGPPQPVELGDRAHPRLPFGDDPPAGASGTE